MMSNSGYGLYIKSILNNIFVVDPQTSLLLQIYSGYYLLLSTFCTGSICTKTFKRSLLPIGILLSAWVA